jgi:heterodisulfide reductase subunit A2
VGLSTIQELQEETYDVLVVGAGIGGMEAAVSLGDMGFRVLLVDREPSIGGHMYLLSKVFPTLDCASCISGTKMSSSSHHPNVTLLPYSDVQQIVKEGEGRFRADVLERPRYVDPALCTSCGQCEEVCPIIVEKENDFGLRGRKAIYIPFDTAVPKKAVVDIDNCIYCLQCERICPGNAIDFLQTQKEHRLKIGAVVLAVGYDLFPAEKKSEYHYGEFDNVLTSMQMDRLLGPTRPYNAIVRNSDGKEPQNIAYALCTGSRDRSLGNPRCSQVCCMYSVKQAQLILGSLPAANVTLYYMDIRAYGKGFEEFYQQAKAMGVNFVRGKVAKIEQKENGDLEVYHEDTQGKGTLEKTTHDMVVLSVGLIPRPEIAKVFANRELKLDDAGWIQLADENRSAVATSIDGVFAAGCATGPKDIPDSAVEAAASASECAAYLLRTREREGAG